MRSPRCTTEEPQYCTFVDKATGLQHRQLAELGMLHGAPQTIQDSRAEQGNYSTIEASDFEDFLIKMGDEDLEASWS
jgi:hypothetical protein